MNLERLLSELLRYDVDACDVCVFKEVDTEEDPCFLCSKPAGTLIPTKFKLREVFGGAGEHRCKKEDCIYFTSNPCPYIDICDKGLTEGFYYMKKEVLGS